MALPFSRPFQLICFPLSQLRRSFLHLSTHLTDGRKPFKSSKSIISHFSILSVLVASKKFFLALVKRIRRIKAATINLGPIMESGSPYQGGGRHI